MSIFDDLVTPVTNRSMTEWRHLVFEEVIRVYRRDYLKNSWWYSPDVNYNPMNDPKFFPKRLRDENSFYNHILQTRMALGDRDYEMFDKAFENIFHNYGVLFELKVYYRKDKKRISGLKFKPV